MNDFEKKNVNIFINGTHSSGNEDEKVDMFVKGNYTKKNGKYYLDYYEYEDDYNTQIKTTVKISDEKIVLIRSGEHQTHLILQQNRETQGIYSTPMGLLDINISNSKINNQLNENGGNVNFKYSLNLNGSFVSTNDMNLNIVLDDSKGN